MPDHERFARAFTSHAHVFLSTTMKFLRYPRLFRTQRTCIGRGKIALPWEAPRDESTPQSSRFIGEVYLRLLDAVRGASAADDVVCSMLYCCGWSRGLSAALRLNSVNVAERSSSDRSRRRPSIWLTFHPLISSPICTRSIFAVPARTMARVIMEAQVPIDQVYVAR